MIRLITKNVFDKILSGCTKFTKYEFIKLEELSNITLDIGYYLIDDFGIFVYSEILNLLYVPENNKKLITPDIIRQNKFSADEWVLEKVSDKVTNPLYTLNRFRKYNCYVETENLPENSLTDGDWIIRNLITEEVFTFSTKIESPWENYNILLFAFPEKLEYPIVEEKCLQIEKFIIQVALWDLEKTKS